MKIRINDKGRLFLARPNKFRPQYCPFRVEANYQCGDWCPLFHFEKVPEIDDELFRLNLCQTAYYFKPDDVVDERATK